MVKDYVKEKEGLDPEKLEDKILSDIFDNCVKLIEKEDAYKLRLKVNAKDYKNYMQYIKVDLSKYQTNEDL